MAEQALCENCKTSFIKKHDRHRFCCEECSRLYGGRYNRLSEIKKEAVAGGVRQEKRVEPIIRYAMERGISYGKAVVELERKRRAK